MSALISRSAWGATEDDGFRDRPLPVTEFWLHHSVTLAPDLVQPYSDDDAAVRTLERIGESRFGGGISYTNPVTPVGRIYVGHSFDRVGAHTRGHNTVGAAYCLVGDYSRRPPTAAQEEAIARDMVRKHRDGDAARHTLNGGHTDAPDPDGSGTLATACPGDAALARIPAINRRANELWAAGYPGGSTPPPPKPTPESSVGLLSVDGWLGPRTIVRLQAELKSKGYPIVVDGRLSRPSMAVKALQRYLNRRGMRDRDGRVLATDGLGLQSNEGGRYPAGSGRTDTIEALERYLKVPMSGFLGSPSRVTVVALQRRLNADTF